MSVVIKLENDRGVMMSDKWTHISQAAMDTDVNL